MSVTQISSHSHERDSNFFPFSTSRFSKVLSLFLQNNIIVMVVHAVISIQFISIVYLAQIVTSVGKYKNNHFKRRLTPY